MIWMPDDLAAALCVQVETDAGDDFVENMIAANAASVAWTEGRLDTGTYLDTVEFYLEVDPLDFVNESLRPYLPQSDLL